MSETTQQIIDRLSGDLQALRQQLETDHQTVASIRSKIKAGQKRSRFEIDTPADRLLGQYESISAQIKREFRESLSVFAVIQRSFVGLFKKEASMQTWIDSFQQRCEVQRIFVQFYDYVEREDQAIAPILETYEMSQRKAQSLFSQLDR